MPYLPKIDFMMSRPSFRSMPALVVGMPVARAICCLACVTPSARFHENETPGIFITIRFLYLQCKSIKFQSIIKIILLNPLRWEHEAADVLVGQPKNASHLSLLTQSAAMLPLDNIIKKLMAAIILENCNFWNSSKKFSVLEI